MLELKNPRVAVPVVLFAGLLWSFGPLVVRYMDNPNLVPWQYIFGRGLTIFILLNLYLYFEEGLDFWKNYLKIGKSGVVGGSGLGIAMISFIYSITNTIVKGGLAFMTGGLSLLGEGLIDRATTGTGACDKALASASKTRLRIEAMQANFH